MSSSPLAGFSRRVASLPARLGSRFVLRPALGLAWRLTGGGWPGWRAHVAELNDRALQRVPGMTSPAERAFVKFLAARCFKGRGAVVELGTFLGALTVALGRGLAANRSLASVPSFTVFDRFVADEFMAGQLNQWHGRGMVSRAFQAGDSFRGEFDRQVAPLRIQPRVVGHGVTGEPWLGGPVELLVIDAMKDFPTSMDIARQFYPSLMEGAWVVHQDFAHYWSSWIHLLHHHLADCFQFEYHVPDTSTVLYRCLRAPTPGEIAAFDQRLCEGSAFINAAFQRSLGQVGPSMAPDVQAAHVMAFLHVGRPAEARACFDQHTRGGSEVRRELAFALEHLERAERASR